LPVEGSSPSAEEERGHCAERRQREYGESLYEPGPPTMFLCGNDAAAKAEVPGVIRQFGWEPFDRGSILASTALEPLSVLWCITGFC
jgi:hypothetical protein